MTWSTVSGPMGPRRRLSGPKMGSSTLRSGSYSRSRARAAAALYRAFSPCQGRAAWAPLPWKVALASKRAFSPTPRRHHHRPHSARKGNPEPAEEDEGHGLGRHGPFHVGRPSSVEVASLHDARKGRVAPLGQVARGDDVAVGDEDEAGPPRPAREERAEVAAFRDPALDLAVDPVRAQTPEEQGRRLRL